MTSSVSGTILWKNGSQSKDSLNTIRREARQVKPKAIKSNFSLITVYNPVMKILEMVLNDNLHILYDDPDMKKVFSEGTISVTWKRRKCLK